MMRDIGSGISIGINMSRCKLLFGVVYEGNASVSNIGSIIQLSKILLIKDCQKQLQKP
jgi:hypothetical protein